MLRSMRSLRGHTLGATDGEVGQVHDLYFDDTEWVVRYLVADTRRWLPGRLVLISPSALGYPDWATGVLAVNLTRQHVEKSPSVNSDKPVSRQREDELARHYGRLRYWDPSMMSAAAGVLMTAGSAPEMWESDRDQEAQAASEDHRDDPHLHSARTVAGYHVQANDGRIGHVEDFVVDDERWVIRYLVIDTKNWWPSRKVLMLPIYVVAISWDESIVRVNAPRETVASGPTYDQSAPINREYE